MVIFRLAIQYGGNREINNNAGTSSVELILES